MTLSELGNFSFRSTTSPAASGGERDQARQDAKLKQACQQFEGMMLGLMFKEMRKTVGKDALLGGGFGEDIFRGQLDQAIADSASQGGQAGIANLLYQQLSAKNTARPGANPQDYLRSLGNAGTGRGEMLLPVKGEVTSTFGPRVHPLSGELKEHEGLDLAAPEGTPVQAAYGGRVSFAGERGAYGNLVVVEHPDGGSSYYGHLKAIAVAAGQAVKPGQSLGTVGQTGVTTGPQLHFELRDAAGSPRDPLPLMAKSLAVAG